MRHNNIFFLRSLLSFIFVMILSITACDTFTLQGPQPEYIETVQHEPFLNVLGVLRPDSLENRPLSFIHLENTFSADDMNRYKIVVDAKVTITLLDESASHIYHLAHTDLGVFEENEYRHPDLFVKGAEAYRLCCEKEGYPVLNGLTTVPAIPQISDESLKIENGYLSFQISRDEQVGMYEVFLQGHDWIVNERILRPVTGPVPVQLHLQENTENQILLTVYAFDLNLSEYLTVNLSIKPNIYQSDFSMVQNGYGCFGSLNILERTVFLK